MQHLTLSQLSEVYVLFMAFSQNGTAMSCTRSSTSWFPFAFAPWLPRPAVGCRTACCLALLSSRGFLDHRSVVHMLLGDQSLATVLGPVPLPCSGCWLRRWIIHLSAAFPVAVKGARHHRCLVWPPSTCHHRSLRCLCFACGCSQREQVLLSSALPQFHAVGLHSC